MDRTNKTTIVLAVIGLVADIVTISSVMVSSEKGDQGLRYLFTDIHISEWHMTFIWFIALVTYLGLVRSYWESRFNGNGYSNEFLDFLVLDLVVGFRLPFLLLPGIVVVGLFFVIWGYWAILFFFVASIPVGVFLGDRYAERGLIGTSKLEQMVADQWSELKDVIERECSGRQWVSWEQLKTWGELRGLPKPALVYALKKYGIENPKKARFGNVHHRKPRFFDVTLYGVLISLNAIDRIKYWYE